ncbi:MAG: hypothetical protein L6427_12385 [Actinomycetia bacterium]|nr:hypothetical protein [Actinomycetes bacterium]
MKLPRSNIPFPPTEIHRDKSKYNRRDLPDLDLEAEVARLDRREARLLLAAEIARQRGDAETAGRLALQADDCRMEVRDLLGGVK